MILPCLKLSNEEKTVLVTVGEKLEAGREVLVARLQEILRTTVFSNRGFLLPRYLDGMGQAEIEVFLRFLKTTDAAESATWGAKLADEGLGVQSFIALAITLHRSCFDLLEAEDRETLKVGLKAASIHLVSLTIGFHVAIEDIIRKEQAGISQALYQTLLEERRQAQNRLIHSEKLTSLGRLTASIAHELSNPITGLKIYFQHALSQSSATDPNREYLEVGADYVDRMANLLRYLQDFSSPPQDERTSIEINQVLERVLTFTYKQLEGLGVEVIRSLTPHLPPIRASASQLEQVFMNLIINAAESMPEGGELRVSTKQNRHEEVIIEFADTGTGISPENMGKIFEPFFTTKKESGIGLGLSISYRIVEEHEGSMEVESEVGKGSIFQVKLPVQAER